MKTYGELKATIADWLDREDLDGRIPDFIKLAEAKIYRGMRTRDNEFTRTYVAADDPYNPITLPENFLEVKAITANGRPLDYISEIDYYAKYYNDADTSQDRPSYFTIIERKLYVYPWPLATLTVDEWGTSSIVMQYYGTESLTDKPTWATSTNPVEDPAVEGTATYNEQSDQNTTRLFQLAPDAYLYGALMEATMFLKQIEMVGVWEQKFSQALASLRLEQSRSEYSGSVATVKNVY